MNNQFNCTERCANIAKLSLEAGFNPDTLDLNTTKAIVRMFDLVVDRCAGIANNIATGTSDVSDFSTAKRVEAAIKEYKDNP